ncbi:MAG: sigma 54-interacting transcriptional regulator [Myxococcales bacterium]|nr:sigma 54-interacting transcriptional regulator [Myxococcales bacterium]
MDETEDEKLAIRRTVDFGEPRFRMSWTDRAGPHTVTVSERVVVGSADRARIVVADPTVSRLHAELELREDGLWVRDLGSRNGTFVRGVFVVEARLSSEREIRLGSITVAVEPAEAPAAAPGWPSDSFGPLVGKARGMQRLYATLARVAPTEYSVLVQGETGTGKELVARAIHEASPRRQGPLVVVDCAAIPETLLESQLFGHARGAFTGAVAARVGDVEAANGGTLFLDEVGELPLSMQPKLLRVLESRTIRRVGESQARPVDVRVVSATHRDLLAMVNAGTFREDLYFRLAAIPVQVPPLRERVEDVPLLVRRFLPRGHDGVLPAELTAELAERRWPGNVRELRNFVERAVALGPREALALHRAADARASAPSVEAAVERAPAEALPPNPFAAVSLDQLYKDFREQWSDHGERVYLERLLDEHGGNVAAAAERAGLDRTHVYRLLRKHRR